MTTQSPEKNTKRALGSGRAPCSINMYIAIHYTGRRIRPQIPQVKTHECFDRHILSPVSPSTPQAYGMGTGLAPFPPSFLLEKESYPSHCCCAYPRAALRSLQARTEPALQLP